MPLAMLTLHCPTLFCCNYILVKLININRVLGRSYHFYAPRPASHSSSRLSVHSICAQFAFLLSCLLGVAKQTLRNSSLRSNTLTASHKFGPLSELVSDLTHCSCNLHLGGFFYLLPVADLFPILFYHFTVLTACRILRDLLMKRRKERTVVVRFRGWYLNFIASI